jgi:hypothetical protein
VILYAFLVGVPPFHARNPQTIINDILNRNIAWSHVPDEMSDEAQDLIDRCVTPDFQPLGACCKGKLGWE